MKVLLTGGQGFLGRRVLDFLLEKGYAVKALTRRPAPELSQLGVEVVEGNLLDFDRVAKAAQGVDGVIHCAAKSGVWGPLHDFIQANTLATSNILTAARRAGAGWLVHTSSPSVAHTGAPLEGADESAPYAANTGQAYPYSKMLAEKLVLAANEPGFRTTALRPHLIWGPGDPHFLPRLISRAKAGRLWLLKPEATVDGTYIDNAALAHVLAAEKMADHYSAGVIGGQAYFITQGEPLTAAELISKILKAVSPEYSPLTIKGFLPSWLGRLAAATAETLWSAFDIKGEPPLTGFVVEELTIPHWFRLDKARRDLGYIPQVSMEEGLKRLREQGLIPAHNHHQENQSSPT